MLFFVLIVLGLIVLCTVFAIIGARIGAQMEEKNSGAGTVESSMREGMSANVLGGLVGIVPFLVFIIALVITVITNPAHPDEHGDGSGSSAESSH